MCLSLYLARLQYDIFYHRKLQIPLFCYIRCPNLKPLRDSIASETCTPHASSGAWAARHRFKLNIRSAA